MAAARALRLLLTLGFGVSTATGRASLCARLTAALGVRLRVEGRIAGGPVLFVANHVSWIDILALRALAPFCFLAKSEVGRWPLIGRAARAHGAVFVERGRKRSIPGANRAMAARLAQRRPMLMFPQGTTTDARDAPKFLSSHFGCAADFFAHEAQAQLMLVQPMAIFYDSPLAPWLGDEALVPHLWRVLRAGGMACVIRFGEPFAMRRGDDRKAAAREAAARVEAMLAGLRAAQAPPRLVADVEPVSLAG